VTSQTANVPVGEIVPELVLRDPAAGAAMLRHQVGFVPEGAFLRLGNQRIALRQGASSGHGPMDHLALAVDAVAPALAAVVARGGKADAAVTPDGPVLIPEFWDAGTEYVFVEGPEGARIELCARPGSTRTGLPGHDHLGIACRDLAALRGFFLNLGLTEIAATVLRRPAGDVAVAFLSTGVSTVELYVPPIPPVPAAGPFWRGLMLAGLTEARQGPEGVVVRPLTP
jgi:catechol 2,3-dioxygenase-like lactoylglutathione lyase family enzyme